MPKLICVNKFRYNPDNDTYYANVSQFENPDDLFQPLWPDNSVDEDVGFRLKAHSDPSMWVEYMLADTEHDNGDVSAWIFVAVPNSHTMRMGKLDSKVKIINF